MHFNSTLSTGTLTPGKKRDGVVRFIVGTPIPAGRSTFTNKLFYGHRQPGHRKEKINIYTDLLVLISQCLMYVCYYIKYYTHSWSQWPRGLRRRCAAARLLRLWVWIPMGAWMIVCFECCVFRGLCDELITHPEESYRLWCVVVCDLETSWMRRPWPTGGCRAQRKKKEVDSLGKKRQQLQKLLLLYTYFYITTNVRHWGINPNTINPNKSTPTQLCITYSMVQSPSWEGNWFAASQEIPRILWNPKVH
jgi:hypothetical protein